jgi:hypothetical protein
MLAYFTILCAAIAGYAGAATWVIGIVALALTSLSYAENHAVYRRSSEAGASAVIDATILASLLNALIAGALAYGAGILVRVFEAS